MWNCEYAEESQQLVSLAAFERTGVARYLNTKRSEEDKHDVDTVIQRYVFVMCQLLKHIGVHENMQVWSIECVIHVSVNVDDELFIIDTVRMYGRLYTAYPTLRVRTGPIDLKIRSYHFAYLTISDTCDILFYRVCSSFVWLLICVSDFIQLMAATKQ